MDNKIIEQENYGVEENVADTDSYLDNINVEIKEEEFSWKKEIYSWLRIFIVAFVIAWIMNTYVLLNADVPSGSMENTIMTNSRMLGNRLSYKFGEPKRGDVVIFEYPDNPNQLYVKRIIGLPGETVTIKEGKIYINDSEVALDEEYLKEEWVNATTATEPYEIPEDCYFMLGDNRNNSSDSRAWKHKYVKRSAIKAKAMLVYWPYDHINVIDGYEYEYDKLNDEK